MWLFAKLVLENLYEQTSPYKVEKELELLKQQNYGTDFNEKLEIA